LFLLYEAAGIFANLGGGWLATRFGIPRMLMTARLESQVGWQGTCLTFTHIDVAVVLR